METTNRLLTPEGGVGFGWQAQDLHPAGACGNAAAGDAARGATQVERAAKALIGLIEEVRDYPLDAVTQKTAFNG
jgi:creatinine amidohydrolase